MIDGRRITAGLGRWLAGVSLCWACACAGQPVPVLSDAAPVYLKQGEAREIALEGQNLTAAQSVMMTDARGVSATLVAGSPKLKITAAADAALGDREMRVVTPTGVTAPLRVTIGQFPLIEEKEPNDTPDTAQAVELPAEIAGAIQRAGESDFFRFVARRGEHLIFDAHAMRNGSPLEAVLSMHATSGHELPRKIEYHAGDPMLVFDAPADGTYLLQVRDLQYRGGANYSYRIESGAIPYIESISPLSGQAGQRISVRASGHNLKEGEQIELDLTGAAIGTRYLRAHTAAGWSNAVPFMVAESPVAEVKQIAQPGAVTIPANVSGVLREGGQEDGYSFHVASPQQVMMVVTARETGSPLDALLTLKSANGGIIEQSNGTADSEAKISRTMEAGDYLATLRDLTFAGGESYSYRLSFSNGVALEDFSVRALPEAMRVARGGNMKLWCDVKRSNGMRGPVTLGIHGLPAGVSAGQAALEESTSGVLTLSASAEAALGTYPLQITAMSSGGTVRRVEKPVYLTVLPAGPVNVQTVAQFEPRQWREYEQEMAALTAKLSGPNPKLDAGQVAWEKTLERTIASQVEWEVVQAEKATSAGGATLTKKEDGSVIASGKSPDRDTYSIDAKLELKGITAIRLEALSDPSLPANGPGRAMNGNIVISRIAFTSGSKPVSIKSATATFEQNTFTVASAAGLGPGGGWALAPELGKNQTATFVLASPLTVEEGSTLGISLLQNFGSQHTLGRFRLSVTKDPRAGTPAANVLVIPAPIVAVVRTPVEKRTAEQKATLLEYYRSTSPELAVDRAKLTSLREGLGGYAEMAHLKETLETRTPQIDAEQASWEKTALEGGRIPAEIAAILKVAADKRRAEQKAELAEYFLTIAPSLDGARHRMAEMRNKLRPLPLTVARNQLLSLPVPITRQADFNGDVQVFLEGFSSGRDPATRGPMPIAPNLVVTPLILKGADCFGNLAVRPSAGCELGTRMVVLRTETKIGPDTYEAYSFAFPLTVTEK